MIRPSFDAHNANLDVFQSFRAVNNLLECETTAVRVTEKNVGHLCLHFGAELYPNNSTQLPYFTVRATRKNPVGYAELSFSIGDVILFVRGEIHKFDEKTFNYTFTTDELIEYRCTKCGKISGDNQVGTYKEKHVAYTVAYLDGSSMQNVLEHCNMDEVV